MDSHYHQVMNKREKVESSGTRLYFAYSGVLDRPAFEQWRAEHSYQFFSLPEAKVVFAQDVQLIFDFPSRWWGGRVAGLASQAGSKVYGLLFEINDKDWPIIQHKEGVITGMSVEIPIEVTLDGKKVMATAFTTSPHRASQEGPISQEYMQALIRGAKMSGLPDDYVKELSEIGEKV